MRCSGIIQYISVQKLERDMKESQNSDIPQGEGQDKLSLLPNRLYLKVTNNNK